MSIIPIVELIRLEENYDYGTFGTLLIQKEVFCVTLERPDLLNTRSVSSIPAQQYYCERVISPRFGETFEVKDVPGRTHILFHALNVAGESEGCIGLGRNYGKTKGHRGIMTSQDTFKEFMTIMKPYKRFHLTIKECY